MSVKTKLKNLAIVIDSISEANRQSFSQALLASEVETVDFYTKDDNYSGRKSLLSKFKKLLLNNVEISEQRISEQETQYDLIIKVGKNSLEDSILIGASYAEIFFADVADENFNESHIKQALANFEQRKRNFGI